MIDGEGTPMEMGGCENEHRIAALEKNLEKIQIESKEVHEKLSNKVEQLNLQIVISQTQFSTIQDSLREIKNELSTLKEKPTKRWDAIVSAAISGIVGFVVAWIMNGPK